MKNININTVLIFLLGCMAFYLIECRHRPADKTVVNNYYDSSWKSLPQPSNSEIIFQPKFEIYSPPVGDGGSVASVDTLGVLRDYFTKRAFQRQYTDSNIDITAVDTVYQNSLLWQDVKYRWKQPVRTEIIKTEPETWSLSGGAYSATVPDGAQVGLSLRYTSPKSLSVSLGKALNDKTGWLFGVEYRFLKGKGSGGKPN